MMLLQVTKLNIKPGAQFKFSIQRNKVFESTKQLQFHDQSLKA